MHFSAATILALPLLAAATAVTRNASPPPSQCTTGSVQCCSSVQDASSTAAASVIAGLLADPLSILDGVAAALAGVTGNVGLTCSPLVGVLTSTSCNSQAACCTGNNIKGGLIVLECDPINL